MDGETDLQTLLASLQPVLHEPAYVFCSIEPEVFRGLIGEPVGVFHELEGMTLILTHQQASLQGLPFDRAWACITLTVHSSLFAVGFLAAITARLAAAGISVNAVSAYYHDHLFVPWDDRERALEELEALSRTAAAEKRR